MLNSYVINTCMGSTTNELPFLTNEEFTEFNNIGRTGKTSNGTKMYRTEYLNSLNKGEFTIIQTKWDNGNFVEKFIIVQHVNNNVDEKCESVLKYLFPNYKEDMTLKQFENAMNALKTIAE